MANLIVRCSSLKKLMTNPRSKSELLSETTKTWIKELVKEEFYGYHSEISSKAIEKGNLNEYEAIELLNDVLFKAYKKNNRRKENEWLTGECDIDGDDIIRDIKNSWSLETFPAFIEDAEKIVKDSGYDWQVRGYMILWDKPKASIDFCITSTPHELLHDEYDNFDIHLVDNHDPRKRITSVYIDRDLEIEKEMFERYKVANEYYQKCWDELLSK